MHIAVITDKKGQNEEDHFADQPDRLGNGNHCRWVGYPGQS